MLSPEEHAFPAGVFLCMLLIPLPWPTVSFALLTEHERSPEAALSFSPLEVFSNDCRFKRRYVRQLCSNLIL